MANDDTATWLDSIFHRVLTTNELGRRCRSLYLRSAGGNNEDVGRPCMLARRNHWLQGFPLTKGGWRRRDLVRRTSMCGWNPWRCCGRRWSNS